VNEYRSLLRAVIAKRDLDGPEMTYAIGAMMDGTWTPAQSGGFLAALAAKGESPGEVVGAAQAMRARALQVEHGLDVVVDTCGTGGDGAQTINVSTIAGFVLAGCGLHVAKHGNRAASSACGSADVLEAAGVPIDAAPNVARKQLEEDRFAFLFAQQYHPAAKEIAPTRRQLGVRTIFNVLGPLCNPARATHQVIGVSSRAHLELVGEALASLGAVAGAVVHAENGIDEVTGDVPTHVYQFGVGGVRRWVLEPSAFGVQSPPGAIAGGNPAHNALALASILAGERSPRADVIALNAALVLVIAERAADVREGLALAQRSLHSGAAREVFDRLRRRTEREFA